MALQGDRHRPQHPRIDVDRTRPHQQARLRVERAISSVGRALTNKTFLTVFLAIAIVIVLVIGYMQLS